jgi:heme oxygenase
LDVVTAYWLYQSSQDNQKALALVWALLSESLERRFDDAFGVVRTEQERNEATTSRIKALESDLANLGEGFALDDEIRRERNYFESLLKQNGIEPYGLPSSDRTEGYK